MAAICVICYLQTLNRIVDLVYDSHHGLDFFFEVIGIIKRKALIKELAAVYHAECLAYCQELLELQRKWDEVRYAFHSQPLII